MVGRHAGSPAAAPLRSRPPASPPRHAHGRLSELRFQTKPPNQTDHTTKFTVRAEIIRRHRTGTSVQLQAPAGRRHSLRAPPSAARAHAQASAVECLRLRLPPSAHARVFQIRKLKYKANMYSMKYAKPSPPASEWDWYPEDCLPYAPAHHELIWDGGKSPSLPPLSSSLLQIEVRILPAAAGELGRAGKRAVRVVIVPMS